MSSLSQLHVSTFVLFLSLFAFQFLTVATATCHADDYAGLLGFKSGITADPSKRLEYWKEGTDCCQWFGVTCGSDNRVMTLELTGQTDKPDSFLSGTISPSLSKLVSLNGLYLDDLGNISGTFPDVLLSLRNLNYVYIENSKISGQIPANIGDRTGLVAFSLSGNRVSGPILSSISKLTKLTQLKLGGNQLTGTIPVSINQLKKLTYLQLGPNLLSGTIPDLSLLTELRILELSGNKLSGEIPPTLSPLSPNLRFLELGHNNISGTIPDFLGNFHALDTLDLSSNHLSGTVPKTFVNLTKIFNLDLSGNLLVDPFPQLFVKGIESLDLSYNGFHLGEIPKWVASSPIIYSLKLAKCGIKIKLDDWKPTETFFYDFIDLSENEISGSPVALLNSTEFLVEFSASGNQLKFNMESLKFPTSLKKLDLSRNLVFGKVTKAVVGIEKLNVSNNHLCGPIPATKLPASAFDGNDCLCGAPLAPCKAR